MKTTLLDHARSMGASEASSRNQSSGHLTPEGEMMTGKNAFLKELFAQDSELKPMCGRQTVSSEKREEERGRRKEEGVTATTLICWRRVM